MGVVELEDEVQRVVERQVAEGRAASTAAFIAEAVMRLVDDARIEESELHQVLEAGSADIAAGRFTLVATAEDGAQVTDGMIARLRARFAAEG